MGYSLVFSTKYFRQTGRVPLKYWWYAPFFPQFLGDMGCIRGYKTAKGSKPLVGCTEVVLIHSPNHKERNRGIKTKLLDILDTFAMVL